MILKMDKSKLIEAATNDLHTAYKAAGGSCITIGFIEEGDQKVAMGGIYGSASDLILVLIDVLKGESEGSKNVSKVIKIAYELANI